MYLGLLPLFIRAMVRTSFLAAAFGDSFGAFHHERAAELAESAGWLGLDRILAVRIMGARIEESEASFAFDHVTFFADWAVDTARNDGLLVVLDEFAFREIGTGDEAAVFSLAFDKLAVFAVRTGLTGFLGWLYDFAFFSEGAVAVREA